MREEEKVRTTFFRKMVRAIMLPAFKFLLKVYAHVRIFTVTETCACARTHRNTALDFLSPLPLF